MEFVLIFIAGIALGFAAAYFMQRAARAEGRDAFRALSTEALRANNHLLLDLAKNLLGREQEAARHDLEKRTLRIHEVLKPLDEKLTKIETHNQELEKARLTAYEGLKQHLAGL